jgi:hypothetical protein
VGPDYLSPGADGRLSLARICALTGRHEEAAGWFAAARRVLRKQSSLPLLAVTDYDEALMYARRGEPGDVDRAGPLLESAGAQFEAIDMMGWLRRAEELRQRL